MLTRTLTLTAAVAALAIYASSANAVIIFAEDFESVEDGFYPVLADDPGAAPDVTAAQSDGNTSGAFDSNYWVKANQGFGSGRQGLVDEDHGDFTDPAGKQAYAFRYTNSGLTTVEGLIGTLAAGNTYIVSFDVVLDGHNSTTPYRVSLVTFDGAARNDVRNNTGATATLASANGDATGDGLYTTVTFSYTSDGTESVLGHDVALRIFGATSSAIIDNVTVDDGTIPEPASLALIGLGGLVMFSRRR